MAADAEGGGRPDRSGDDRRRSARMAAAQAGDRAAYDALLRECVPLARAAAARQGVPRDRVDDVVQEALMTAHRVRQTYDPARSFDAWFFAIARRRAIDALRRAGRHGAREVHAPAHYESHADPGGDPSEVTERAHGAKQILAAAAALPPRQREAVDHLVLKEQTTREAAAATGRSEGALKVNLHRALRALRSGLRKDG